MQGIAPHLERLKRGEDVEGRSASGNLMPMDEFQGRDLAKFLGRAGRRLVGRDGLGKLLPGSGPEHDQLARSLDRLGKSLEGEGAQRALEQLFEAFGGGGGGERDGSRQPKLPDMADMRKRLED